MCHKEQSFLEFWNGNKLPAIEKQSAPIFCGLLVNRSDFAAALNCAKGHRNIFSGHYNDFTTLNLILFLEILFDAENNWYMMHLATLGSIDDRQQTFTCFINIVSGPAWGVVCEVYRYIWDDIDDQRSERPKNTTSQLWQWPPVQRKENRRGGAGKTLVGPSSYWAPLPTVWTDKYPSLALWQYITLNKWLLCITTFYDVRIDWGFPLLRTKL